MLALQTKRWLCLLWELRGYFSNTFKNHSFPLNIRSTHRYGSIWGANGLNTLIIFFLNHSILFDSFKPILFHIWVICDTIFRPATIEPCQFRAIAQETTALLKGEWRAANPNDDDPELEGVKMVTAALLELDVLATMVRSNSPNRPLWEEIFSHM